MILSHSLQDSDHLCANG